MENLKGVVDIWEKQADLAQKVKQEQFGKTANFLWGYLGKSFRNSQEQIEASGRGQGWGNGEQSYTCINKVREFVNIFLPYIHEKVPNRVVLPRMSILSAELKQYLIDMGHAEQQAQGQQVASMTARLMQDWLNYLPKEYDLYREGRLAATEALMKGRGVMVTEMEQGPYGLIPVSRFTSVDDWLIDPDCRQPRDAGYMIQICFDSVWKLSEEYGIEPEKLRGNWQSYLSQAREYRPTNYPTNYEHQLDIAMYYRVYSRMGMGTRFKAESQNVDANFMAAMSSLGDHVRLDIMPGLDYPLNLQPDKLANASPDDIAAMVEWPIRFYAEQSNPWPCTFLDFYPNPDNPWATAPLESASALLVFMDEYYAWLMTRIRATRRLIPIISKQIADDKFREALNSVEDLPILYVDGNPTDVTKLTAFLEFPDIKPEMFAVASQLEQKFEQASGMVPTMYGEQPSSQDRSAAATDLRAKHLSSRPDDFADANIEFNSKIAQKEAQASRMLVGPEVVAPLFNEQPPDLNNKESAFTSPLSWLWASKINTTDERVAASDFEYTCEAGTGVRRNKQKQMQDLQLILQKPFDIAGQMLAAGNPSMWNNIWSMISEIMDLPGDRMMIQPPPQQQQPSQDQNPQGNGEQMDANV